MLPAERVDLTEYVSDTIAELEKDRPNRIKWTAAVNTIGQAIQTVAAVSPAYQALKAACVPLGIHLP